MVPYTLLLPVIKTTIYRCHCIQNIHLNLNRRKKEKHRPRHLKVSVAFSFSTYQC